MPERAQRDLAAARPLQRLGFAVGGTVVAAAALWTVAVLDAYNVIQGLPGAGTDLLVGAAVAATTIASVLILGYLWQSRAAREDVDGHRGRAEARLAELLANGGDLRQELADARTERETLRVRLGEQAVEATRRYEALQRTVRIAAGAAEKRHQEMVEVVRGVAEAAVNQVNDAGWKGYAGGIRENLAEEGGQPQPPKLASVPRPLNGNRN